MVHRTATADDKKLQSSLKKLAVNNIAGIEEVNWCGSSAYVNSECYINMNVVHSNVAV